MKNIKKNRILIFAAHPDDEVLGCGGTIAKKTSKGYVVQTVFFSDGVSARHKKENIKKVEERKKSAKLAAKILKTKPPIFGKFPDNQLDTISFLKIVKFVEKYIKIFKPSIIYTHFPEDLNIDHRLVSLAVSTACRPQKNKLVKKILFFEIPSSTEWKIIINKKNIFNPNWYEDISKTLDIKIKSLKVYGSELKKWPHPRSLKGVKSLAQWRGATVGYKAAESFVLGRRV